MSNQIQTPILVTGAAGHLGKLVVQHLLDTYNVLPSQIIATTRKPESLAEFAEKGVQVRAADFDDPASLANAFAGAARILLVSTDTLGQPGKRVAQHKEAIEAAKLAGVSQVLYTSMPSPAKSKIDFAPDHLGTEEALLASSLDWTLLRNNWYFENLLMGLPAAVQSGTWYSAAGDGRVAYLSRNDLARAAAAALVSPESTNKTYTLTGSVALSTEEIAAAVTKLTGKPITVQQVPVQAIAEAMKSHGLPEALAVPLASIDTGIAHGDLAEVTGDYQALTGQAPTPLSEWLKDNRQALG